MISDVILGRVLSVGFFFPQQHYFLFLWRAAG
jgi:hypothetical protein